MIKTTSFSFLDLEPLHRQHMFQVFLSRLCILYRLPKCAKVEAVEVEEELKDYLILLSIQVLRVGSLELEMRKYESKDKEGSNKSEKET